VGVSWAPLAGIPVIGMRLCCFNDWTPFPVMHRVQRLANAEDILHSQGSRSLRIESLCGAAIAMSMGSWPPFAVLAIVQHTSTISCTQQLPSLWEPILESSGIYLPSFTGTPTELVLQNHLGWLGERHSRFDPYSLFDECRSPNSML